MLFIDLVLLNVFLNEIEQLVLISLQLSLFALLGGNLFLQHLLLVKCGPSQVFELSVVPICKVLFLSLLKLLELIKALEHLGILMSQLVNSPLRINQLNEAVNVRVNHHTCEAGALELQTILVEFKLQSFFQDINVSALFFIDKGLLPQALFNKVETSFEFKYRRKLTLHFIHLLLHDISMLMVHGFKADMAGEDWEGMARVHIYNTSLTKLFVGLKLVNAVTHVLHFFSHFLNERLLGYLNMDRPLEREILIRELCCHIRSTR